MKEDLKLSNGGGLVLQPAAARSFRMQRIAFYVMVGLIALAQLFPLIWLLDFSFLKSGDFFDGSLLKWPNPFEWKNYANAFQYGHVAAYFLNSMIIAVVTVVLSGLLSLMLAYALSRMQWRGRNFVLNLILIGMMIPIHATLLPNFMIFHDLNLLNSYWALILPNVAFSLPVNMFILNGALKTIPRELEEAAVMDGAGVFRILFTIITPLLKPSLAAVSVLTFLSTWNEFIMANTFITSEAFKTLPFSIIQFTGQYSSNYGAQFAVMTIIAVPSMLIYLLFTESMTKGITGSSFR